MSEPQLTVSVFLNTFGGTNEELNRGIITADWDTLRERMFSRHLAKNEKIYSPCFTPCSYVPGDRREIHVAKKSGKQMVRLDRNVTHVSMAVIDVDEPGAFEVAQAALADFERVSYSTWSYAPDKPYKRRIVLPFAAPAPVADWKSDLHPRLMGQTMGDPVCSNVSRLYYLPSHPTDLKISPILSHHRGRMITVEDIRGWPLPETKTRARSRRTTGRLDISYEDMEELQGPERSTHHSREAYLRDAMQVSERGRLLYDWESLTRRHADLVEESLVERDSRHDLALRLIAREVAMFGDEVDIGCVVGFIDKASRRWGRHELRDGDTIEQLDEIFQSAAEKYRPGLRFDDARLERGISWGLRASRMETWPGDPQPDHHASPWGRKWSYPALAARHVAALDELHRTGNCVEFARSVALAEHHDGAPATPVMLFLLSATSRVATHRSVEDGGDLYSARDEAARGVGKAIGEELPRLTSSADDVERWRDAWRVAAAFVGCEDMPAGTAQAAQPKAERRQTERHARRTAGCRIS